MKHTYRIFLTLVLSFLCFSSGFLLIKHNFDSAATDRIADEVLRLHIIANSDSAEDQVLKLEVKSVLVDFLQNASLHSREEMITYIENHQTELTELARTVIHDNGYLYPVQCALEETYFPAKTYGDLTFPRGDYLALRVLIGEAKGKNWWCVLYPPLCFLDITTGIVPETSKDKLANTLEPEDYQLLTDQPIIFRFRLWEELKDWFSSI